MVHESFNGLLDEALSGIRVIDISNFLAGPISSMFLGDFGADVIVSQLLLLDTKDPERNIKIFINSPGGSVTAVMFMKILILN